MTTEREGQGAENPIDKARSQFNKSLFAPEYNGSIIVAEVINLQNVLLTSDLSPERVYHELSVVSGQAAELARLKSDQTNVSILESLKRGFDLTYNSFGSQRQTETPQPTVTSTLPPMSRAKGGTQVQSSPEQSQIANAASSTEQPKTLSPNQQEALDAIRELGTPTVKDLSLKLGIPESVVSARIQQLRAKGVKIESQKEEGSRKVHYKLAEPDISVESPE